MIYQWFLIQKKETKIAIVIGLIAIIIISYFGLKSAYWKYQYFKGLKNQVKELVQENKSLTKDINAIDINRKDLQLTIDRQIKTLDSLKKHAKTLEDEANQIPDIVRTYPDKQLDSILTNYRHIKRSKN